MKQIPGRLFRPQTLFGVLFPGPIFFALMICLAPANLAAQTPKTQRPVKNPPQYPSIIDLESKGTSTRKTAEPDATVQQSGAVVPAALVRAVESLASEVRTLVQEMRALNVRQQAQLDLLRLTRGDLRIDSQDRDLRAVTERLAQVERDEQALRSALTPEGLAAQVSRVGTIDRDETMRMMKRDLEARLATLLPEKERLKIRKAELEESLGGFREANERAEKRIELIDEALRQLTGPGAGKGAVPRPDNLR
ncbi:MAG: hypothetical protein ABI882_14530 [Acidobacteriota bacterium]